MTYKIEPMLSEGLIELSHQGDTDIDEYLKARSELLQACKETGISKLLVDTRESYGTSITEKDAYKFGNSWPLDIVLPDTKIALIVPSISQFQKQVYFAAFLTQKSGVNLQVFEERPDAVAWLAEQ